MPIRRALVAGASGQDGSYLCEELIAEGTEVHALHHAASSPPVAHHDWAERVVWHDGDISDAMQVQALVEEVSPDEIYNLAGISSVAQSWELPILTAQITGLGAIALMQAGWLEQERTGKPVRMVQASSAEIFGTPPTSPQTEQTPLAPTSPYGAAKAYAHQMAAVYRIRGLGVSSCILYNHESPRRPTTFVTRKITRTAVEIALGKTDSLALGNLDALRDWGWAPDYVDAMVRSNRCTEASDFIIATGVSHSVLDFVRTAFAAAGVEDWEHRVTVDPAFVRPADPAEMRGDASHAREVLGWSPTVEFDDIVARMVAADFDELRA